MYSRRVGDQTLTLGHTWDLAQNSFIFYDVQTKSLWIHGLGEAFEGPMKGNHLEFLPSRVATWKAWKRAFPHSTIARRRSGKHHAGIVATIHHGLSITLGSDTRLYPFEVLETQHVINDTIDGMNIVVVYTPGMWVGAVFDRGDHEFQWKEGSILDESGANWDMLRGVSGEKSLTPLAAVPWLIDRWRAFYPQGSVYSTADGPHTSRSVLKSSR